MNNVPCVASDLPGVRRPVQMHNMGRIVPVGDPSALAQAILEVLAQREKDHDAEAAPGHQYDPDTVAAEYEKLFGQLMKSRG